jgi:hypothetical protein
MMQNDFCLLPLKAKAQELFADSKTESMPAPADGIGCQHPSAAPSAPSSTRKK